MKRSSNSKLFFSMTWDFLNIFIPQDSSSKLTVKSYQDGLTVFRRYLLEEKNIKIRNFTFEQCTFDFILDYRNWLLDVCNYKKSTVNSRIATIKSYLYYASGKDISLQQIYLNISAVPFLRVPKNIRPIIDNEDTLKALLNAPANTKTGCRDTMILAVLYDTMIRAAELINLDIKDVRIDAAIPFLFIHGKGNKERTVPLSDGTVPLIAAYIAEYHMTAHSNDTSFVFTMIHGNKSRMSERNIERIVKKYADQIRADYPDLPTTVYPHMLRRTRGTGLYRDGVAIEVIAVAMGHASIQTTKDHYAFASLEQKRNVMNQGNGVVMDIDKAKEWPDDEEEFAKLCGLR